MGDKIGETSLSSLTKMTNVMAVVGLVRAPRLSAGGGQRGHPEAVQDKAEGGRDERGHDSDRLRLRQGEVQRQLRLKLEPARTTEKRIFVRGSSTVGIAKILAGCRLQTYYPITPASDESEYLEAHENIELEKTHGRRGARP